MEVETSFREFIWLCFLSAFYLTNISTYDNWGRCETRLFFLPFTYPLYLGLFVL